MIHQPKGKEDRVLKKRKGEISSTREGRRENSHKGKGTQGKGGERIEIRKGGFVNFP